MKALSDRRVLVVDDLRANVQLLAKVLESELAIARSIQMGILPRDLSPVTRETGLDVAERLEPARLFGGDLYVTLVCARIVPGPGSGLRSTLCGAAERRA